MQMPVCPHCGKVTEGEIHDKEIYLLVVCEECFTILGVLPKYFQKCTWKAQPKLEGLEEEEAPADVLTQKRDRQRAAGNKWD